MIKKEEIIEIKNRWEGHFGDVVTPAPNGMKKMGYAVDIYTLIQYIEQYKDNGERTSALYLLNEEIKSLRFSPDPLLTDERYSIASRLEVIHSALSGYQEDRNGFLGASLELDAARDMIKYLLPLAKGYVHANPGIKSTENIIEDAEAMLLTYVGRV